jgi:hypothetical protein
MCLVFGLCFGVQYVLPFEVHYSTNMVFMFKIIGITFIRIHRITFVLVVAPTVDSPEAHIEFVVYVACSEVNLLMIVNTVFVGGGRGWFLVRWCRTASSWCD